MTLQLPVKSMLEAGPHDAEIARGWQRIERKRRARHTARKSLLAVCCLTLAGAVGWAVRPLVSNHTRSQIAAMVPVPARPAGPLDSLVQQLPRAAVQGRTTSVQRPLAPPVAAPPAPSVQVPDPELDVVAALLESVRDAYDHGDVGRASALLSEIAEKHPDDPRTSQALYVLGLIQLEKTHDPKGAKDSFTRALELDPPAQLVGPLWQALQRSRGEAQ